MLLSARRTHLQQAPVSGIASPPRSRPSGQRLRGGRDSGDLDSDDVLVALARVAQGADPSGYRGEFLQGAAGAGATIRPVCDILGRADVRERLRRRRTVTGSACCATRVGDWLPSGRCKNVTAADCTATSCGSYSGCGQGAVPGCLDARDPRTPPLSSGCDIPDLAVHPGATA